MAENKPGRLKIFLGMSAGVGKTYTMLRDAQVLKRQGVEPFIAWLEPHGNFREETSRQADGFARIPTRSVEYRGMNVDEMDLDAVLAARPELVLVDELAHSNTPGMRHPKRWQDIYDLLDAGIDVYTTVNIQHLESMADTVEGMTGVRVNERVPDSVFDRADNIQVVDISPDELLERLRTGKVYTGPASRNAVENFFRPENLAALREIALRQAAQIAGQRLSTMLAGENTAVLTSDFRVLVAVSSSPNSEYLLRWSRRLAFGLKTNLTCLYVETGSTLNESDKERLVRHLTLARNLGARVVSMIAEDVPTAIINYAAHNGISTLVIGKSGLSKTTQIFGKQPITDRLIRESGNLSVIAVQERASTQSLPARAKKRLDSGPGWHYLAALAAVAAITGINLALSPFTSYQAASIFYLATISLIGMVLRRSAVFSAAVLSALLWDFLFIPPRYTFIINKIEDIFMLLLYFLLALSSGWAAGRLRDNARMLQVREQRMEYLNELALSVGEVEGLEETARTGLKAIERAFAATTIVLLKREGSRFPEGQSFGSIEFSSLGEKDLSAAAYCLSSGQTTGRFTGTLPVIALHFIPLAAPGGTIGVVGLRLDSHTTLTDDQRSFLLTLCRTLALALEREQLIEQNKRILVSRESERLSAILLNSVSHELRTPLTVIAGSASALADPETADDAPLRGELVASILDGSRQLEQIVENLLSMNRLDSGTLKLKRSQSEASDLIAAALEPLRAELATQPLHVAIDPECPEVSCDEVLIVQVISNLVQNALRHTPAGTEIRVSAAPGNDQAGNAAGPAASTGLCISVEDSGPGVDAADLPQLFDKFYRGKKAGNGGTGLGLSICRGIVEIHGGSIHAENRSSGGLRVWFTLPHGSATS